MEGRLSGQSVRPQDTLMFREAAEAPDVVARQRASIAPVISKLAERLRAPAPRAVLTLARGSSDHAATFARYLIETRAGVLTSSASPSVGSVYQSMPDLDGAIVLAISQSGQSPDLLAAAAHAQARGAMLVALVNDEQSPLAAQADVVVPLGAGSERSVAATKSYIASLSAMVHLLATWANDPQLHDDLLALPTLLADAWGLDWSPALNALAQTTAMYVIGRGHALGAAQEIALKLKETCGIQAEAFSAAEVRHGPMALVREGFPVLLLGQRDESLAGVTDLAKALAQRGATVITAGVPDVPGIALPVLDAEPSVAPILQVLSFYKLANSLALARGLDPDRPQHLSKVTETL